MEARKLERGPGKRRGGFKGGVKRVTEHTISKGDGETEKGGGNQN